MNFRIAKWIKKITVSTGSQSFIWNSENQKFFQDIVCTSKLAVNAGHTAVSQNVKNHVSVVHSLNDGEIA